MKRKLSLTHHIINLSENDLAKEIFEEQVKYNLPGLANEVGEIIEELGLPNIIKDRHLKINKYKWKKLIKEKIKENCVKSFLKDLDKFEKLKNGPMRYEQFKKKDYINDMTMSDAQIFYKFRSNMTNVKFNYKNDQNYSRELWKCDSCMSAIETQSHILYCPAYQELREGKSIDNDEDLVKYISEVFKIRDKLNIKK